MAGHAGDSSMCFRCWRLTREWLQVQMHLVLGTQEEIALFKQIIIDDCN